MGAFVKFLTLMRGYTRIVLMEMRIILTLNLKTRIINGGGREHLPRRQSKIRTR